MSGGPVSSDLDEPQVLESYLEELLSADGQAAPQSAARAYRLVSVAGIRLALRAEDAVPSEANESEAENHDEWKVIDVASIVTGRPAAASRRRLRLPAHPRYLLAVDEVGEVIRCTDASIRWREAAAVRPWLAGMMAAPAAAVVSVEALVGAHADGTQSHARARTQGQKDG